MFVSSAVPALLLAASPAFSGVVAEWTNSSLNASGTNPISASVGTASIVRGSGVTRVNDNNNFSTTNWPGSEGSAPNFGNDYIQITADTRGASGMTLSLTHSRSSFFGPEYVKFYAETAANTYTQIGSRISIPSDAATQTVALPASLEGKQNARIRIHVYSGGNSSRYYALSDIAILTANAAPVLTAPAGPLSAMEDVSMSLGGITVADSDAGTADLDLQISATNGTVTFGPLGGATVVAGSNGSGSVTVRGTLTELTSALGSLSFKGNANFSGSSTVSLRLNDRGNSGLGGAKEDTASFTVNVAAVNDAPVLTAPSSVSGNEDANITVGGISISDEDAGAANVELTLSATNGTVTFSSMTGLTVVAGQNGTASLTVSAPISTLNTRLGGLSFRGTTNFAGAASLALSVSDLGNSGGAAQTDTATVAVGVNAVNDAPVNSLPAGPLSATEDTARVITGVSIADVDAGSATIQVQVSASNGTVTFASLPAGVNVFAGSNGSSSVTLRGALADLNLALASFSFRGSADFNGTAGVTVATSDLGNTGGAAQADSDSLSINVAAVNDVPVLSAPATLSGNEDTNIPVAVSVSDADAGSASVDLTLSATSGTVTLSSLTGLQVISGQNGTADLSVRGPVATLNTRLTGLSFRGLSNETGSAVLNLLVNDRGNTGGSALTDSAAVAITINPVNDAPVNSLPAGPLSATEDAPLLITGVSISDVDAGEAVVQVQVSASNGGTITFGTLPEGVSVTGGANGSSSVTLRGAVSALNQALASFHYQGSLNFNGSATVTVITNDLGNTGGSAQTDTDTVTVNVSAVNDGPVLTFPAGVAGNEDSNILVNGISIADVDAGSSSMRLTLSALHGDVRLVSTTGLTVVSGSNNSPTVTFQGSRTALNNALGTDNFRYRAESNYNGLDTISILVSDRGNTGSGGTLTDSAAIEVTVNAVNDAPSVGLPPILFMAEDVPTQVSTSVSDVDAVTSELLVTITSNGGLVSLVTTAGLTFISGENGSGAMSFTGTLADIESAVDNMSLIAAPDQSGNIDLTVGVSDQGAWPGPARSDSASLLAFVFSVNDAPVLTFPPLPVAAEEDTSVTILGTLLTDVDADPDDNMRVSVQAGHGTLTLGTSASLNITAGGDGLSSMTFAGTKTSVVTALAAFSYLGEPNFNGTDEITVTVNDLGNSGNGAQQTTSGVLLVNVAAVNDGPSISGLPQASTGLEDTTATLSGATVTDIDLGETPGAAVQVTLSVTTGSLSAELTSLTLAGGENNSASLSVQGSPEDVNAALAGLQYLPPADLNGTVELTVVADDLGGTGSGGALTASVTVPVQIAAVNDAPVLLAPEAQVTDVNDALVVPAIEVADIDLAETLDAPLEVTLEVTSGVLELGTTEGLVLVAGGSGETSVTLHGSVLDMNAALAGVVYHPAADWEGTDSLSLAVSDLGASGLGGVLVTTGSVELNIMAMNDAPVVVVPGAQSVDEDTQLLLPAIVVADADATATAGAELAVTLEVTSGTLSVGNPAGVAVLSGDNTSTAVQMRGTLEDLNAVLAAVTYQGEADMNGEDLLVVTVDDLGGTGVGGAQVTSATVALIVVPVNDAPVITVPETVMVRKETDLPLPGFRVADVDAGTTVQVTVSTEHGTVVLTSLDNGATESGKMSGRAPQPSVTFEGSLDEVNEALATLVYRGNDGYYGADAVMVTADDLGAGGATGTQSASASTPITVDLPVSLSGFALE